MADNLDHAIIMKDKIEAFGRREDRRRPEEDIDEDEKTGKEEE